MTCRLPRCPDQRSSRHHRGQVHWTLSSVEREVMQKKKTCTSTKNTVVINSSCTVVVVVVVVILVLLVVLAGCFFTVCIRVFELL